MVSAVATTFHTRGVASPVASTPVPVAANASGQSFAQVIERVAAALSQVPHDSHLLLHKLEKVAQKGGGEAVHGSVALLRLQFQAQDRHLHTELVTRAIDSVVQTARKLQQVGQ